MGEGNRYFVLSEGKSYGNVLVAFFRQLPMGRKYKIFGVKYQNLLVESHLLNYEEVSMVTPIYIKYVVITIFLLHLRFPLDYFILHNFVHFLGVSLSNYLYLFLKCLRYILDKVKKFRIFWPCSFVDPSVKGTHNFWKVRGIIERFDESRSRIYYGVEATSDESMSDIRFCTTSKGYLPH